MTRKGSNFTTSDLEILQVVTPVEDMRELFRNKTLNTKEAPSSLSKKPHKNVHRVSFIFWEKQIENPNP